MPVKPSQTFAVLSYVIHMRSVFANVLKECRPIIDQCAVFLAPISTQFSYNITLTHFISVTFHHPSPLNVK